MSERVDTILHHIKALTMAEATELVKAIEKTFGVSAHVGQTTVTQVPPTVVEEQTEFSVILSEVGTSKINVLKTVREITGLGLKEAKEFVEAAPKAVKEGIGKSEAESIRARLEAVGAKITVE